MYVDTMTLRATVRELKRRVDIRADGRAGKITLLGSALESKLDA